jgi:alpha-beta hydrolase superfamily lysophospholipase
MGAPPIEKVPIYFGSADRPLFGVYHPSAVAGAGRIAVVLCNPVGDDFVRAHRALRHLAEALSAAGFPVLRFDFDGTGDSFGDERDPDRVATWLGDVRRAVGELRARSGIKPVALVGLKLGGTLAALAAAELDDVDALVLWGAHETGGAFVTEATKAHKIHTMLEPKSFSGGPATTEGREALGFLLTTRTIDELGALDLLAVKRSPARRTLVVDTANLTSANALANHLRSLGSLVTARHMPGQKFLIARPQDSEVPQVIIDAIVTWLGEDLPAVSAGPSVHASAIPPAESVTLRERAATFGGARRLFGILTAPPPERKRLDLPAIIMLNAGAVHRVGTHRLYVTMARRWAALGFHVLRVDLSGIGDSPAAEGCPENLTYPRDSLGDVHAAMDFLSETLRIDRFVLTGLCSGGDITFQIGFRSPRVVGAIMINPRTFCVNDLGMVDSYQQARSYQGSLLRTDSLKKLLRGDVDITRAARIVAPKVRDQIMNRARRAVSTFLGGGGQTDAASSDRPRENDVPKALRMMAGRGVDTYLVVTEHDPGVDYVDSNYGNEMRELASVDGFSRTDVKGTDHTFTALWAQDHVSTMITDHLRRRFLTARAA